MSRAREVRLRSPIGVPNGDDAPVSHVQDAGCLEKGLSFETRPVIGMPTGRGGTRKVVQGGTGPGALRSRATPPSLRLYGRMREGLAAEGDVQSGLEDEPIASRGRAESHAKVQGDVLAKLQVQTGEELVNLRSARHRAVQ
jgi:hypothetical protein